MAAPGNSNSSKKRRKKKDSKYTPLIWILTGAVIALGITYSNTLFKNNRNEESTVTTLAAQTDEDGNALSTLEQVAQNIFNARSTTTTLESISVESVTSDDDTIYIYLAKQVGDVVKVVEMATDLDNGDAPLRSALTALLDYRDPDILNLVPYNAEINDIWIENSIAYIDFNQSFSYNSYGLVGYQLQIYQIVFTATQFDSIDAVYFYSEGSPLEYLGGEGYLLHNPIYPLSALPEFAL